MLNLTTWFLRASTQARRGKLSRPKTEAERAYDKRRKDMQASESQLAYYHAKKGKVWVGLVPSNSKDPALQAYVGVPETIQQLGYDPTSFSPYSQKLVVLRYRCCDKTKVAPMYELKRTFRCVVCSNKARKGAKVV
jgi:hypothetical protein